MIISESFEKFATLYGLDKQISSRGDHYFSHVTQMAFDAWEARQPEIDRYSNISMAHAIADAASCLDDLQSETLHGLSYLQCRAAAKLHAQMLHDIAVQLAGDRVEEVYAPSDEDEPE